MRPNEIALFAEQSTDPDELRELSTSRFTAVRTAVARNVCTPDDVLELLVEDRHHLPRYGVAENPKPSALEVALGAANSSVRVAVTRRQDLTPEVVERLIQDPERHVRTNLALLTRNEKVLRTLALDPDNQVRSVLPRVALTPDDVIEALSHDSDRMVRCSVATSYRASEEQLQRLLRDKSATVRDCVVRWYSRRTDVLEALENDPDPHIARFVATVRDGRAKHGVSDTVVTDALARHRHRSIARLM